jgi:alkylated DNA repair dioxygenase AlkB
MPSDLFSQLTSEMNLLPYDGTVNLFDSFLSPSECRQYFEILKTETPWKRDELILYGKHYTTKRKVAWYGDAEAEYTYSGKKKVPLEWTSSLLLLKERCEEVCETTFNACLLNFYHNGEEGMSWHSDDEKELGDEPVIASLSLGAERRFLFRHKQKKTTIETILQNGSLLIMKGLTQSHWKHSLPQARKIESPRLNLTFRNIIH